MATFRKVEKIQTQHNGRHQDFETFELDDLRDYLSEFKYQEGGTLYAAVQRAVKDDRAYIVEPVNGHEDITIDIVYKD